MHDATDMDDDSNMDDAPMNDVDALTRKGKSQMTTTYTVNEDKCICEAWVTISQDPICGAEQKGGIYWRKFA
jgi:hypothetical protein